MKLTILGNEGPYPKAGGATTSYLLETKNSRVLLDLGAGTLSRLLTFVDSIDDIDVLILSHLHYDHISDVSVLKYMSEIGRKTNRIKNKLKIYAPQNPETEFKNLAYEEAFEIKVIDEDLIIELNDCRISFAEMIHPVQSFAVKVESENKKFVYSSDTIYNEKLINFADETDLLLCECCHLKNDKLENIAHMRTNEVAEIANKSNLKRLIITHFMPGSSPEDLKREVAEEFKGKLEISEQLKAYEF